MIFLKKRISFNENQTSMHFCANSHIVFKLIFLIKQTPEFYQKFIFHGCTRNSKAAMSPGQKHLELFDF